MATAWTTSAIALVVLCSSRPAAADGGELYTELVYLAEFSSVRHPNAEYDGGSNKLFLQRGGLRLLYGISHTWHVGVEVTVTTERDVVARNVRFQKFDGDLAFLYRDVDLPFVMGYVHNRGDDIWISGTLSAGPTLRRFDEAWMAPLHDDPDSTAALRLPIRAVPSWHLDVPVRAMAELQWRPDAWWAIGIGVYARTMLRSGDWQLGMGLSFAYVTGFGPSFY